MKYALLTLIILISSAFNSSSYTGGVNFQDETWSAAVKHAKAVNKPIFAFVRTSTCRISARMDQIFHDPKVAAFFNANFVCVQIFTENALDNIRASNWGATGVPTFFFFKPNKEKIYTFSGFREADAVIKEGETALKMMGLKSNPGKIDPNAPKNKKDAKDDDDEDEKEDKE